MSDLFNDQDLKNNDIIKGLVFNHFGLDTNSENEFADLISNPDIDGTYKKHLGSDLRARFPVAKENLENYDEAWAMFKNSFATYTREFSLSYRDFTRGRILANKNELRIFKHLASYYLDSPRSMSALLFDLGYTRFYRQEDTPSILQNKINEIISMRLPSKSGFEVVLSCNFADWFLCATGEGWTSCLNLESEYYACYWAGLPGFIKDKNRALIYITDGSKKQYKGIVVDRMLSRSFTLLDKSNNINYLRWYPSDNFYSSGVFNELPFKLKGISDNLFDPLEIKHKVKPLFFRNDYSCFAYQDKTAFMYEEGRDADSERTLFRVDKGGQFYLNKNNRSDFIEGGIFSYTGGLSGLIESNLTISNLTGEKCDECGTLVEGDDIFTDADGDGHYCERCYHNLYTYCDHCDRELSREDQIVNSYGRYCQSCIDELFVVCESCGTDIMVDDVVGTYDVPSSGEYYCRPCSRRMSRVAT